MEKIIIFGAGKKAEFICEFLNEYGEFEVIEIWDNSTLKIGQNRKINGICVEVKKPHYENKYNIVISSDTYYEEIRKQLIKQLKIQEKYIKPFGYIFKNFKKKILYKYKNINDKSIKQICKYLQKNELDVFCGQIKKNYTLDLFDIYKDYNNGLLYSFWKGKRIYLSSKYTNENDAKAYLCSLCREQDINSPHNYNIDKLDLENTDIFIDAGAAEGFFALQIIDDVKHIYLVEGDEKWITALRNTFEPYKDKVTIIEKWLDEIDTKKTISLDGIAVENANVNKIVVKMDIEGKETDVIRGMKKLINSKIDLTCIVCTYHKSHDEDILYDFFKNNGFETSFSYGYMFFPYGKKVEPELRKAVLTAKKYRTV